MRCLPHAEWLVASIGESRGVCWQLRYVPQRRIHQCEREGRQAPAGTHHERQLRRVPRESTGDVEAHCSLRPHANVSRRVRAMPQWHVGNGQERQAEPCHHGAGLRCVPQPDRVAAGNSRSQHDYKRLRGLSRRIGQRKGRQAQSRFGNFKPLRSLPRQVPASLD